MLNDASVVFSDVSVVFVTSVVLVAHPKYQNKTIERKLVGVKRKYLASLYLCKVCSRTSCCDSRPIQSREKFNGSFIEFYGNTQNMLYSTAPTQICGSFSAHEDLLNLGQNLSHHNYLGNCLRQNVVSHF